MRRRQRRSGTTRRSVTFKVPRMLALNVAVIAGFLLPQFPGTGTSAARQNYLNESGRAGAIRHMFWVFIPTFTWLVAGTADAQPSDKNWAQCTGDIDNDNLIIAGCTA